MAFTSKLKKHMFLTTSLLLVFVFIAGILVGRNIESRNYAVISEFLQENELNTESYIIEQGIVEGLGEDNCDIAAARIERLSEELGNIGRRLSAEDAKQSLGKDNYNFLKRKFHLMQIKTYVLFKSLIDSCNIPANVILYYYSVDEDSQEQGFILDKIVRDYNAKVFAIEYNYSPELNFLESYYSITETPSLVINYKSIYEGFTEYKDIAREMSIPEQEQV